MAKDYTKFDLTFLNEGQKIQGLSKTELPLRVFEYLIEKDILDNHYFKIFSKNNFGRTWYPNLGDLLNNNPNMPKRYKEFYAKGTKYYACSQWQIDTITKFINYVNKEFCDYIKIDKSQFRSKTIDVSALFD